MKHITLGLGISSRRRTDLEVTNSVVISVDRSRERAKRAAKVTCAYLVSWLDDVIAEIHGLDMDAKRKISNFIRQGDEKSAGKLVDDRMLDLLTVTGTVEECVERCREHLSYGIDQIAFCDPLGPKPENSLELIAKKIIPRL